MRPNRSNYRVAAAITTVVTVCVLMALSSRFFPVFSDDHQQQPHLVVESDDPLILRTGQWNLQAAVGASGDSYLYNATGQETPVLSLQFSGPYLEVIYVSGPNLGILAVEIDGTVRRTVITALDATHFMQRTVIDYLTDESHTLSVYAVQGVIAVDAFIVSAASEQAQADDEGGSASSFCQPNTPIERLAYTVGEWGTDYGGPVISGDGRLVAFQSLDGTLVPNDTNAVRDVFVYDRQTCVIERVSVSSSGAQANNRSTGIGISADGRYVVFRSYASNLVTGDTNGQSDIFRHDRQTGTTIRVSVDSNGTQGTQGSLSPAISGDGRYITFISLNSYSAADTNNIRDVYWHDTITHETLLASVSTAGIVGNQDSNGPVMSNDGRYVAFESMASNLVANDTNESYDIFVRDTQTNTTIVASVANDGTIGNLSSHSAAISGDGRFVAFNSYATNFVPGSSWTNSFFRDLQTNTTSALVVDSAGQPANGYGYRPSISNDGRYVAFESDSTEIIPGDTNGQEDIFWHDRQTGEIRRAQIFMGQQPNGMSSHAALSGDGQILAFMSEANNLVSSDPTGLDVFVYDVNALISPSLLQATAGNTQITLTWVYQGNNGTEFRLERSLNGTDGWVEIAAIPLGTTYYTDTGLQNDTTYYYRVRVYRSADASYSAYSNTTSNTPIYAPSATASNTPVPTASHTPDGPLTSTPVVNCNSLSLIQTQLVGPSIHLTIRNDNAEFAYITQTSVRWHNWYGSQMFLAQASIIGRPSYWIGTIDQHLGDGYTTTVLNNTVSGWNDSLALREVPGLGAVTTVQIRFNNGPANLSDNYTIYNFGNSAISLGGCTLTMALPTVTVAPTPTHIPSNACTAYRFEFVGFDVSGLTAFRVINEGSYLAQIYGFMLNWRVLPGYSGQMNLAEIELGQQPFNDPDNSDFWDGQDLTPATNYIPGGTREGTIIRFPVIHPDQSLTLYVDFDGLSGTDSLDALGGSSADFADSILYIGDTLCQVGLDLNAPTPVPTNTPTWTPTSTNTVPPTATPSNTATNTPQPTSTSTYTPSWTATVQYTPTHTPTHTNASTSTATFTPSNTLTPLPTATPTETPSVTLTPSSTFGAICSMLSWHFDAFLPGGVVRFQLHNTANQVMVFAGWIINFPQLGVPAVKVEIGPDAYDSLTNTIVWSSSLLNRSPVYISPLSATQIGGNVGLIPANSGPASPYYVYLDFDLGVSESSTLADFGAYPEYFGGSSFVSYDCPPIILDQWGLSPTYTPSVLPTATRTSTATATRTFTPSPQPTATRTSSPTPTKTAVPQTFDTLAIFDTQLQRLYLMDSLNSQATPLQTVQLANPNSIVGVMGDWNGDGLKTPGYYAGGIFYTTNLLTPTQATDWYGTWFGWMTRPVVAGRFAGSNHDCVGVVDSGYFPPFGTAFALYYTCDFSQNNPPKAFQWLSVVLPDTQGFSGTHQFEVGDFDGDGLDSVAIRRGAFIAYTNVTPGAGHAAFAYAQYWGSPDSSSEGEFVSGDWDGDTLDSFGVYYPTSRLFYRRNDLQWNSGIYQTQGLPALNPATVSVSSWYTE